MGGGTVCDEPVSTRLHTKVSGVVSFKCESVATLDPVTFDTPESFVALSKWTAKKAGSISFDFRTTEPNGLMLFSHGKPRQQQRKDPRTPPTVKVKTLSKNSKKMYYGSIRFCATLHKSSQGIQRQNTGRDFKLC